MDTATAMAYYNNSPALHDVLSSIAS